MAKNWHLHLSRRERQIMEIVYRRGQASAADITGELPDPPSYSAVRALLRVLEEKGHLRHRKEGKKYVFLPTVARNKARRSAMRQLLRNFFDGSVEQAVASLLSVNEKSLSDEEFDRLSRLIEEARKEDRSS